MYHIEEDKKDVILTIRMSEKEKNLIQTKANLYSDGNISRYARHILMNFNLRDIDLKKEKVPRSKKPRGIKKKS